LQNKKQWELYDIFIFGTSDLISINHPVMI
jgi:hypothetical protein